MRKFSLRCTSWAFRLIPPKLRFSLTSRATVPLNSCLKAIIHKDGKAFLRVPLKDGVVSDALDLSIVKKHTYLGISIEYGQFEKDTLTHRCSLAWGAFGRLKPILCDRSISRRQRLQLWQACVFATLQYGLTCTDLTSSGAKRVRTLVAQQVRSIAGSFSMFTHEFFAQATTDDVAALSSHLLTCPKCSSWPVHETGRGLLAQRCFKILFIIALNATCGAPRCSR